MQFLNPLFLFGLIATLIPIALHFFKRERTQLVQFSDLRFLNELQKNRTRRIFIRQWLILIIRILFIVLITLAFARPTYQLGRDWGGQPLPTAAAVLVDLSFYTQYKTSGNTLFDRQLKKLKTLISSFDTYDAIAIIPITTEPGNVISGELERLIQQSERLKPNEGRGNISTALFQAISHLNKYPELAHKIFLLSTGSNYNWPEIDIQNATLSKAELFLIETNTESFKNTTISELNLSPWMANSSKPTNLIVKIANIGNPKTVNRTINLFNENQKVSRHSINLKAGVESTVNLPLSHRKNGWISGYVEIEKDNLAIDNRRYFSFKIPKKTSITLIESSHKATYYLQEILSTIVDFDNSLSLRVTSEKNLTPHLLESTDVLILSDLGNNYSDQTTSALYQFVENGGGLLIFPSNQKNLEPYHQDLLQELIPFNFLNIQGKPSSRNSLVYFDPVIQPHPIFKDLFPVFPKEKVFFYAYAKIVKQPGLQSLMHFNNGDIAIASGKRGLGLTIFSTFPLDLDWTNWPLNGSFSSAIQRLIRQLTVKAEFSDNYLVGEQPLHQYSNGMKFFKPLELISPAGTKMQVNSEKGPRGYFWKMPILNETGIWYLRNKKVIIRQFAVNVDTRIYRSNSSVIGNKRITLLNEKEDLTNQIKKQQYGKELWQICIIIALLLLILEIWFGRVPRSSKI